MKKFLATALISTTTLTSAFAHPLEAVKNTAVFWHYTKKEIKTVDSAKLDVEALGLGLKFDVKGFEFNGYAEVGKTDGDVLVGNDNTGSDIKLTYSKKEYFFGDLNALLNAFETSFNDNSKASIRIGMGIENETLRNGDEWENIYMPLRIKYSKGKFFSMIEMRYYAMAKNNIKDYGKLITNGYGGTLELGYKMFDRVSISAYATGKYLDKDKVNKGNFILNRELKEEALGARFTVNF